MAWGSSNSEGPVLAIHFAESDSNGYLFVKILDRGKDGVAVLIRSVDTGELAVRKFPLRHAEPAAIDRSKWLPSEEVTFSHHAVLQWRHRLGLLLPIPCQRSSEGERSFSVAGIG